MDKKKKLPETVSTIALLIVMLGVTVVLAMATDLNILARGLIGLGAGLAAAVIAHVSVTRMVNK